MLDSLVNIGAQCWLVLGQMAPYLLFGFLVAGLLSVWISPQWVERHLGRRGFGPVLKASLIGVPLPLCSCGVIPVSASMRRHGASRAATTSFLLSTPQTGVDSIAVTYALLGPVFALFRPIAALLTGLVGGGLVQLFGERDRTDAAGQLKPPACTEPCCADKESHNVVVRALRYGFVTLPRDIGAALLAGIVIAGLISVLAPPGELQPYVGGGLLSMLLMIAVGIPIYVCASASVPIAAGFIHLGASPGAALAFLIAGPATNAATITTVWKLLGKRTALLYLLTIAISAIGCGLLLDWLFAAVQAAPPQMAVHHHADAAGWPSHAWAIVLLAILAYSYWSRQEPQPAEEGPEEAAGTGLQSQRIELAINGMTCSHCTASATRALAACAGVDSAEVTLQPGRAVVRGTNLDPRQLVAAVTELGYSANVPNQTK
jgi:uncharacterized membrane protein YraQ (UPF0718 family)/copper chaperone CopZ